MSVQDQIKQQKSSNKQSLRYYAQFKVHREHQTALILNSPLKAFGKVCILGAGNCNDINLKAVADKFDEVHLVDIDRKAISAARGRLPAPFAKKIHLHAPLDISGCTKHLESWRDMRVTPEELMALPEIASSLITESLSEDFDLVVSSSVLSQILLICRQVLTDDHPLLDAVLITCVITHLRTLEKLHHNDGQALFVSDVSSNEIAPLEQFKKDSNIQFLDSLISANQVFNYLNPRLIKQLAEQDPNLGKNTTISEPVDTWLWHNGPIRTFLVYAIRMTTKAYAE